MHPPTRSHRAYAGWVIVVLLGAAVAAVTLRPAGAQDGELSNPAVFAETTYANNCAECHGADGTGALVPGTDREGPSLVGRDDITTAYMDLVLRTGRMPPPGDPYDNRARQVVYSDAEREAIVAWTADVFDLQDDMPDVGEGDVARGLELFALNCAHCHGNTGAGGTAGQNVWTPQIEQLDAIAIAQAIRVGPFEMPAFGPDALPQQDVDDIATYLAAVDAESGTPVLGFVELNPVFASGMVGVLAAVLIGSLMFIGGRPVPFELVTDPAGGGLHTARVPVGLTEDPDAPDPGRDDPGPQGEEANAEREAEDEAAEAAGDDDGTQDDASEERT